eukprot:TRINITY_DN3814_c0_g1_i2.p1 TRINITY_DN3814_c0_g1~~TRINITY_DN3814_c0_g1_i2.p1  ORF type:complete len:222 (+),score=58.41 TRINITY_DN3814_c0_g1_i2:27-668(+)
MSTTPSEYMKILGKIKKEELELLNSDSLLENLEKSVSNLDSEIGEVEKQIQIAESKKEKLLQTKNQLDESVEQLSVEIEALRRKNKADESVLGDLNIEQKNNTEAFKESRDEFMNNLKSMNARVYAQVASTFDLDMSVSDTSFSNPELPKTLFSIQNMVSQYELQEERSSELMRITIEMMKDHVCSAHLTLLEDAERVLPTPCPSDDEENIIF